MERKPEYFICPHCGIVVKSSAPVCPECGSDYSTGLSENVVIEDNDVTGDEPDSKPMESRAWHKYVVPSVAVIVVSALLATMFPWGIFAAPVLIIAAGAAFYATRLYPGTPRATSRRLEHELLRLVHSDKKQMERLVLYEGMRNPGATRTELLDSAIERLKRDRR
jgi:hypothetical protein